MTEASKDQDKTHSAVSMPRDNRSAETATANRTSLWAVIPRWWSVVSLWFAGEERWKARGFAAAVIALSVCTTLLSVKISYAQRNFSTALAGKDKAGFTAAIWEFVLIIVIVTPFNAFNGFVEDRLVLAWRTYLTKRLLSSYFSQKSFFNIQHNDAYAIDNPDQRICEDVNSFVRTSVTIIVTAVLKVCNCLAFAGVLYTVSGQLVAFLFAYAIFGTIVSTSFFGKVLMRLYNQLLKQEGDMRFSLVRVRENAESIAFYGGERQERRVVAERFNSVVTTTKNRIKWHAYYDLWNNAYAYATVLIPPLLTAPRYFKGEIEFGVVTQAGFAFSKIESAMALIVHNLDRLSTLGAQTERLQGLMVALDMDPGTRSTSLLPAKSRVIREEVGQDLGLGLMKLTIQVPKSTMLICKDLSVTVMPGESLLVVGQSGCGKSSLLRVIAGLWTEGRGTIRAPDSSHLFFLPQKPFMPLGTLRRSLLFPSGEAHVSGSGASQEQDVELAPLLAADPGSPVVGTSSSAPATMPNGVDDQQLLALLEDVRLGSLVEKVGGLDAEMDWGHVLSLGEQQRVAMLRLLLHRPHVAFLDEATSALDAATETKVYSEVKKQCKCYVSVGHRLQLVRFHTHVLEYIGDGVWEKMTAAEFNRRTEAKGGMSV